MFRWLNDKKQKRIGNIKVINFQNKWNNSKFTKMQRMELDGHVVLLLLEVGEIARIPELFWWQAGTTKATKKLTRRTQNDPGFK